MWCLYSLMFRIEETYECAHSFLCLWVYWKQKKKNQKDSKGVKVSKVDEDSFSKAGRMCILTNMQ